MRTFVTVSKADFKEMLENLLRVSETDHFTDVERALLASLLDAGVSMISDFSRVGFRLTIGKIPPPTN